MRFVCAFFLLLSVAYAQEEGVQFEEGNLYYRKANFEQAARAFEGILKNGYESVELYYDLGNCYFKLQNYPAAILAFERARRLSPRDEDVLYNLRLANLRVIDKIEPVPQLFIIEWWRNFVNLFPAATWALIAIACLWTAALAGTLFLRARSIGAQRSGFMVAGLAILLSILAFMSMYQRIQAEQHSDSAIVFAQSVSAKSAPDPQSTDLFVLHEGVKVDLLDEVGDWRKIRLADGKVGWLTISAMQII